ncbi:MAG TPA: phosphoribosylamine--glycine ligase, partial [Myxococcota bacterium]|nr:phosphoribosylamine--glycine ligase [Myxococcota bacterium]
MKILIVGGGGREHALAWALHRHGHSLTFTDENPAFAALGTVRSGDPLALAASVNLVVIGPEAPLAAGLVNRLHTAGIPAFGPTSSAARLETSKIFGKRFCARHGLPAPGFTVVEVGESYTATEAGVVKLDG